MITLLLHFIYPILEGNFFGNLPWQNMKYTLVIYENSSLPEKNLST